MTDIFFTSAEHKNGFLTAMQGLRKIYDGKLDPEYGAAIYILTSSASIWDETSDYVDRSGIRFDDMLSEVDFSGGYSVLIRLAGNLFNDRMTCNAVELMRLDDGNFSVALTALQVRRASIPVSELESEEE